MRYAIPALILAGLIVLFAIGLSHDPTTIPSPLIGKPAPAFNLPTLEGGLLATAGLQGKPVVVNFWASWCAPCLSEHPVLMSVAQGGVTLIGINYKDEPADARAWLAQHGNPFAQVAQDREGAVAIDWGVYGVPETFVVDAQGVIRHKHVGPMTQEIWASEIAPLLRGQGSEVRGQGQE